MSVHDYFHYFHVLGAWTVTMAGCGLYDIYKKSNLNSLGTTCFVGTIYTGAAIVGGRMIYEAQVKVVDRHTTKENKE